MTAASFDPAKVIDRSTYDRSVPVSSLHAVGCVENVFAMNRRKFAVKPHNDAVSVDFQMKGTGGCDFKLIAPARRAAYRGSYGLA